jgi:hypothetical protein
VAPTIVTQPASATVTAGQTATFTVVATGTAPVSYQWSKNSVNIPGATNASYTTPPTTTTDSGSFRVIVSNGIDSVTSNAAILTVIASNQSPMIVSPATASPDSATVGQAIAFLVSASDPDGDPLSYTWDFGDGSTASGAAVLHVYAVIDTYTATVNVSDGRGGSEASTVMVTINGTQPPSIKVNFQPAGAQIPSGYLADTGAAFADRGNGCSYGWNDNNAGNARDRNSALSPDQRYDTLNCLQLAGVSHIWEIAVPNGNYQVKIVGGDSSYPDSKLRITVEGVLVVNFDLTPLRRWAEGTQTVTVSDGRLTIGNGTGSYNNKICFIEITPVTSGLAQLRETQYEGVAQSIVFQPMTVQSLKAGVNLKTTHADSLVLKLALPELPADFKPAGALAGVDIGAVTAEFTLDAKGYGKSNAGTTALTFNKSKKLWFATITLKNGSFLTSWLEAGMNTETSTANLRVPVGLFVGGYAFGADSSSRWNYKGSTATLIGK